MADFGFVGGAYEAASITQDDQALINWYPETDPTKSARSVLDPNAERGVIALYPTPGLMSKAQLVSSEVRGLHTIPGGMTLLAVCGNHLYSVDTSFNATQVGNLYSSTGPVGIADNGVAAYITDGSYRYSYIWGTNTFAVMTDGPFLGGNCADEVDNYIVYSRPNSNEWGCTNVGDIISGALNLGSKIGSSDNIVAIISDHRQVLLLGERTSERWIDVGSFPFPFAIIPGTSMQHGCQAQNSVARLGEGIAFLALDDRGQATVVTWGAAASQPVRISTFAIENAIQGYAVTSDAVAYTYTQSGHEFYVLTFPTADVTWVYDLASQMWHKRAWRDTNGIYHRHRSNCATPFNGDIIVGDFQNGTLYALSQTDYTDDGDPLPCVRRCRHITSDLNRQFFNSLQIQFQPGVGIQSGQGSDPSFLIRWSNDGGFTWGNDHIVKIGQVGQYKYRTIKRRMGYARDRVYEVVVTDPVYRVIVSAELKASAGAN